VTQNTSSFAAQLLSAECPVILRDNGCEGDLYVERIAAKFFHNLAKTQSKKYTWTSKTSIVSRTDSIWITLLSGEYGELHITTKY